MRTLHGGGLGLALLLGSVVAQEPASRPRLELAETLLLDGTLAVRLPPLLAERPQLDPFFETFLLVARRQPGVTLLERATADGSLGVRAVQLPWRASADFGRDVTGEIARWESTDPLRRRFRIEPIALADGAAFLVVPDKIVGEGAVPAVPGELVPDDRPATTSHRAIPALASTLTASLPALHSPANAIVFLKRPDGLVQEVGFHQPDAAVDRTALSRAVAATLHATVTPLATGPRRIEVFPGVLHIDLPDGWISSVLTSPDCDAWILLRKVVPVGQPAPTLAVRAVCGPAAATTLVFSLPVLVLDLVDRLLGALVWPPDRDHLLRIAAGISDVLDSRSWLSGVEHLHLPFTEFPLAGGSRPAGLSHHRRWTVAWTHAPGDLRILGAWGGAPDAGSFAEVEALAGQVLAAVRGSRR